jgi:DNA-binding transcriptional ArsR family regulator
MSLGDSRAELRAMAHPVRLQIMSLLTGASLTAAEVARELGLTHANASYHLRNLLAANRIVVAGEEKIRGGVAKRYRYDVDHERQAAPWTDQEHRAHNNAVASELVRRTAMAEWAIPKQITDADVWVDPEAWREIKNRIAQASRDLHTAAVPPRTPGAIRTSTTIAMFGLEPAEPAGDPE